MNIVKSVDSELISVKDVFDKLKSGKRCILIHVHENEITFFSKYMHRASTAGFGFSNSYQNTAHSCCDSMEEFERRMNTEFNLEYFKFFETPKQFAKWLMENPGLKF